MSGKPDEAAGCSQEPTITFKKIKRKKCLRTTPIDGDVDDPDELDRSLLEDTRELQKLRKRPNGVSVAALVTGKPIPHIIEKISDPYKLDSGGGLVDMKVTKKVVETPMSIGNQFASETNERDEDADMMKYIDEELKKRKGTTQATEEQPKHLSTKTEDLLMQILPNHLKRSQEQKNEEMLSNQMLAGIPEVDLGIEERIRNIEATEDAKLKMLRDKLRNKSREISLVPANISVNFQSQQQQKKQKIQPKKEREPGGPIRASDDAHLEKFKKHFQRR